MSFSGTVKEEIAEIIPSAGHCRLAELAAILGAAGEAGFGPGGRIMLMITSENRNIIKKAAVLILRSTGYVPEVSVTAGRERKGRTYLLAVTDGEAAAKILKDTGFLTSRGVFRDFSVPPKDHVIKRNCCRKAYLRGMLLASGSVSDPARSYHLEFVCASEETAAGIKRILDGFGISSRTSVRKQTDIVYVKESEGIADTLSLVGAHKSRLAMEDVRIMRGISANVNRTVNCETANLNKTVSASLSQIESIELIRDTVGLSSLPLPLREMAEVRLENPELPLKELGELLSPPVGKSGVNHRLRKLKQIADTL